MVIPLKPVALRLENEAYLLGDLKYHLLTGTVLELCDRYLIDRLFC